MTLSEALQSGDPIRRPIPKHMGSHGDGYLDPEYVFNLLICGQVPGLFVSDLALMDMPIRPILINKDDILANDWMVKGG